MEAMGVEWQTYCLNVKSKAQMTECMQDTYERSTSFQADKARLKKICDELIADARARNVEPLDLAISDGKNIRVCRK